MTESSEPPVPSGRGVAAGAAIFFLVLGVFLPAVRNGFINYDDRDYVTANLTVRAGLTRAGFLWAFGRSHAGNWHPLTWISHMADAQIYGLRPWGHHLTSILLHALASVLVFAALRRMTGAHWRSAVVALGFGLHPLHVESAAWVAERKDVLSACFGMLTLWAYAMGKGGPVFAMLRRGKRRKEEGGSRSEEGGGRLYYWLALGFFALGLMCKAMLVTLPFALLLLDYWPLRRLGANKRLGDKPLHLLILEKIPFFALAAADAVLTVVAQRQAGAVGDLIEIPLGLRIENALIATCAYLGKFFWPAKLAVFYPYTETRLLAPALGAAVLLLILTVLAVKLRRRHPYLIVGWLWYLLTLVPVIGLVQVGSQSMADRYTYIPSLGLFVPLVWGACDLTVRWRRRSAVLSAAAVAALAGCAVLTSRQISYWSDSETLFRHALAVTKQNWVAENNLGVALADSGRLEEAIAPYEDSLRIMPKDAEARANLGNALLATGRLAAAIAQYEEALRLNPELVAAHNNLANALVISGKPQAAIAQYEEAIRLNPDYPETQNNLANLLAASRSPGRLAEAISRYEAAIRLDPDAPAIRKNLGVALAAAGRLPEAVARYREAIQLKPDDVDALCHLGDALSSLGRNADAVAPFAAASRLQPGSAEIHNNLGCVLGQLGRTAEARREFEAALRLKPDDAEARANLEHLGPP